MAGRNFLFVPGPDQRPDRVTRAMMVAMEDHRSPIFPELTRACLSALKPVFKTTTGAPILFPSSGTGCWEAALTNCLNAGDKVLASRFGQFSHLWIDMCHAARVRGRGAGDALGRRRAGRALSRLAQRRQAAQDQGGPGVPKRNRHRRDQRCRRRAPGDGQRQAPGASVRRLGERARQHRLSHGRVGRGCLRQRLAEGPDAARRHSA